MKRYSNNKERSECSTKSTRKRKRSSQSDNYQKQKKYFRRENEQNRTLDLEQIPDQHNTTENRSVSKSFFSNPITLHNNCRRNRGHKEIKKHRSLVKESCQRRGYERKLSKNVNKLIKQLENSTETMSPKKNKLDDCDKTSYKISQLNNICTKQDSAKFSISKPKKLFTEIVPNVTNPSKIEKKEAFCSFPLPSKSIIKNNKETFTTNYKNEKSTNPTVTAKPSCCSNFPIQTNSASNKKTTCDLQKSNMTDMTTVNSEPNLFCKKKQINIQKKHSNELEFSEDDLIRKHKISELLLPHTSEAKIQNSPTKTRESLSCSPPILGASCNISQLGVTGDSVTNSIDKTSNLCEKEALPNVLVGQEVKQTKRENRNRKLFVTEECIKSLAPGKWLEYSTVLTYTRLMCQKWPHCTLLPAYVLDNIEKGNIHDKTELISNIKEHNIGFFVVLRKKHFFLVVLDSEVRSIAVLDSQRNTKSGNTAEIYRIWCWRMDQLGLGWYSLAEIPHSFQNDTVNCGIFVCHFVRNICEGKCIPDLPNKNHCNQIRADVKVALLPYLI